MSKIKILIPIYNDWQSAFKLLEDIDLQVRDLKHEFSIIMVNDCSTEEKPTNDFNLSYEFGCMTQVNSSMFKVY